MKRSLIIYLSALTGLFFLFACTAGQRTAAPATPASGDTVHLRLPSHPLRDTADLDRLMEAIGDARVVLLGEASHGTAEYYNWRSALSQRLIREKGFHFIAVEGEWADSYRVNQFVKGGLQDSAAVITLLRQYNRWPTWMWGNYEVASLVSWMNRYNQSQPAGRKAGFYGLDVYCLWESVSELAPRLPAEHKAAQQAVRKVNQCFRPFSADTYQYAQAVARSEASCREETARLWKSVQELTGPDAARSEEQFVLQQHALVALNGETYYRTMVHDDNESWNIRDRHMAQTLQRLLDLHGPKSKAIVWEHNTHVGDARYTDMSRGGMTNVGELVRKAYGESNVFIVGFGSHSGTVIASDRWGGDIKTMTVPPAPPGTWEGMLHQLGGNRLLLSRELRHLAPLSHAVGHRAIGVVYHPDREAGNYVPSVISRRYDAFVFLDKTSALHPLRTKDNKEPPDTFPWGY